MSDLQRHTDQLLVKDIRAYKTKRNRSSELDWIPLAPCDGGLLIEKVN